MFAFFLHCIIIKIGPGSMFYYPLFNTADMQSVVWTFLQPVQPVFNIETVNLANCQSPTISLNGSSCQETKEVCQQTLISSKDMAEQDLGWKSKSKSDKDKKKKQKQEEEEFRPNAPEAKKSRKTPQNANRNVVPNIMHQVISFLQKKNKSQKIVQRLIKKLGIEGTCSAKRFYNYQILIKDKLNHYVNASSLTFLKELQEPQCQVYSEMQQRHYNKISRLLIHYFLNWEFDTIILTSKRVNSEKRLDHLTTKRKILHQIQQMLSQ